MKYKAMRIKFRSDLGLAPELNFFQTAKTKDEALEFASRYVKEWELPTPECIELMDGWGTVYDSVKVWETAEGVLIEDWEKENEQNKETAPQAN